MAGRFVPYEHSILPDGAKENYYCTCLRGLDNPPGHFRSNIPAYGSQLLTLSHLPAFKVMQPLTITLYSRKVVH